MITKAFLAGMVVAVACVAQSQIDTTTADRLRDRLDGIRSLEVEYHTTSTQLDSPSGRQVFVSLAGRIDKQTSSGWMLMQYGDEREKRADIFMVENQDAHVYHLQREE